MAELTVTVKYKGEKVELPLRAYHYGHTYRIAIKVGDEERNFHAFCAGVYR